MTNVMDFSAEVIDPMLADMLAADNVGETVIDGQLDENDWALASACKNRDDVEFFPMPLSEAVTLEDGTIVEAGEEDPFWDPGPALELCSSCPVRQLCLEQGMSAGLAAGVWGGTTEAQRDKLRKGLKVLPHGTVSGYNMGCQDDCCAEAIAVYWADKRNPIVPNA